MLIKDVTDPEDKSKWEFIQECVKNPDKESLFLVCEYLYHLVEKGYEIKITNLNYFNWIKGNTVYKLEYYSYNKLDYNVPEAKIFIKK